MAISTSNDYKIYNDQVRSAYAERLAQAVNGFFTQTRGAVIVQDATIPGDYIKGSFWKFPSGLVTRRIAGNASGYDSAATPVTIAQGEDVRVRLSRKIGPVESTLDGLRKIVATPAEFSQVVGEMAAEAVMQKMLQDAVKALVAALNRSPYLNDISASTADSSLNRGALASGLALMGDRASDVVCWVMHSKAYFDLVAKDIAVATSTDTLVANIALYGGTPATLGKPVIVTDEPGLVLDETVDKYYTLGLTAGAAMIEADNQLTEIIMDTVTGAENLRVRIQGERDWFLGLKGFAWDTANGGANPDDTALATATNWDAASSDMKQRAGIIIKST
jgi:hypothetical protein